MSGWHLNTVMSLWGQDLPKFLDLVNVRNKLMLGVLREAARLLNPVVSKGQFKPLFHAQEVLGRVISKKQREQNTGPLRTIGNVNTASSE